MDWKMQSGAVVAAVVDVGVSMKYRHYPPLLFHKGSIRSRACCFNVDAWR